MPVSSDLLMPLGRESRPQDTGLPVLTLQTQHASWWGGREYEMRTEARSETRGEQTGSPLPSPAGWSLTPWEEPLP